ncbi:MAG: FliI/YscN family ATPase [Planctomycetota bacterium]|nr:FliI/YscN family ATPase [Planctomycetota bacterium]
MTLLHPEIAAARSLQPLRITGSVAALRGLTLLADDLPLPVGSLVHVKASAGGNRPAEVVGFEGRRAIVMTLGQTGGIRAGDAIVGDTAGANAMIRVGPRMLGRVVNGLGEPIDDRGPIPERSPAPLNPDPVSPLRRRRINERLDTGVRAVDLMTPVGRGQRLGIFAGPGVGKSTLLGSIAKHTSADINVISLVGERGREVKDFIERSLGDEGLARSVVVVATSDESPLMRIRSVFVACAIAEFFRDRGADVMLLMDSVTRLAQAQRQVGLAVGEPPATRGYTPSVFAMLPALLERAGAVENAGSITGFYTILVEGDDMTEPIADAARGILDGHLILSRSLAQRGHYPAIDVLDSISRVTSDVCDREHLSGRSTVQRLLAAHRDVEDLLQIGAYARGSNPTADVAVSLKPQLDALLQQSSDDHEPFESARGRLISLAKQAGDLLQQNASHPRGSSGRAA